MAAIDISNPSSGGGGGGGNLQLSGGASMTSTLTSVTDTSNTSSPLKLSTTSVQVVSPLRITTSDAFGFYIDAEDSSTNNRFSVKRDPSSQLVTIDFASNPAGSTTSVGAIRTYVDGVNLSEVMTFREDGLVGVGTTSPTQKLHVNGNLRIETGGIYDGSNNIGTSGQVLSSTGTTTQWVTPSAGSPAGSTGYVQFNTGGSFNADADLFWDNTNKRFGIGTTTPGTHIDVHSGADNIASFNRTGSGNAYAQFALAGTNKWRIGYLNSTGDFIIYDVTNSTTRIAFTNAGVIDFQAGQLKNYSASQNSGGALTITSANSSTYNGSVYNVTGAVTISADNTVPDGFSMTIIQQDANSCTISAGTGLTLRNRQGNTKSNGQWSVISIVRTGSNLILGGDTSA